MSAFQLQEACGRSVPTLPHRAVYMPPASVMQQLMPNRGQARAELWSYGALNAWSCRSFLPIKASIVNVLKLDRAAGAEVKPQPGIEHPVFHLGKMSNAVCRCVVVVA